MASIVEPLKARRIYLMLADRISAGELKAGDRLPGEHKLAAELGVARVTVRRALDQLSSEGLVTRRPGAGTYVAGRKARTIVADLSNILSHLAEMGRTTSVKLLSFAYDTPPEPVMMALGLTRGHKTQRSVRVRLIDGQPFSYLTTHVPERIGITYFETELATMPLLELLERSGVSVDMAKQSFSATLATPQVAEALEVEIGSPLLSLTRVVLDGEGQGIEHLHALYRPDRYEFHMDLVRSGADGARRWSPMADASRPAREKRVATSRSGGRSLSGKRRRKA